MKQYAPPHPDNRLFYTTVTRLLQAESYANELNADKIFISAIPSKETIEFYLKVGCKDAKEVIEAFTDTEKIDTWSFHCIKYIK